MHSAVRLLIFCTEIGGGYRIRTYDVTRKYYRTKNSLTTLKQRYKSVEYYPLNIFCKFQPIICGLEGITTVILLILGADWFVIICYLRRKYTKTYACAPKTTPVFVAAHKQQALYEAIFTSPRLKIERRKWCFWQRKERKLWKGFFLSLHFE